MITPADVRRYQDDGYFLLRGALAARELDAFRAAVVRLLAGWRATGDGYEQVLHQMHQPWQQDEQIADVVTDGRLADAAARLSGMAEVAVFLDQIVAKPPGGAATIAHQDAPFLSFTDDRSLNCWIALDEVTTANGALGYFRGSHRLGLLPRVDLDDAADLSARVPALADLPLDVLRMHAGDAVFHNCHTVHQATANTTGETRRAFSIQYMPRTATYNGYVHEFLSAYYPVVGQPLDQPCFAVPRRYVPVEPSAT